MSDENAYKGQKRRLVILCSVLVLMLACFIPSYAYADECPGGGHHDYYIEIITPVTSTTEGLSLYTCKKCGYQEYVTVESTGHEWSDWYIVQEPTCTIEGIEERVCVKHPQNLHYEQRIIPMLSATGEHSFAETERTNPTCTIEGSVTYTCDRCGYSYTDTLAAIGHAWGQWIVDEEPTATEEAEAIILHDGSAHRICANDPSHQETQVIPASAEGLELDSPEPDNSELAISSEEIIEDDPKPRLFADDFFTATSSRFDRAVLGIDIAVLVVTCVSSLSLFYSYFWIRRRRKQALQQASEHLAGKRDSNM